MAIGSYQQEVDRLDDNKIYGYDIEDLKQLDLNRETILSYAENLNLKDLSQIINDLQNLKREILDRMSLELNRVLGERHASRDFNYNGNKPPDHFRYKTHHRD